MIRKYAAILAVSISAIVFLSETLFAQGAVTGYAHPTGEGVSAPFTFPSVEQFNRLTHVIAVDIGCLSNGAFYFEKNNLPGSWSGYKNYKNSWLADLVSRAHDKGVKVSICISGDSKDNDFYYATYGSTLNTFVANIVDFVNENGLDGVDIDWERPQNPTEWYQCIALLTALKTALPCKRISIALPHSNWFYPAASPTIQEQIWNNVDAIYLMSYDVNDWPNDYHSNAANSIGAIDNWISGGTPNLYKKKLHLGSAFYGLNYKRDSGGNFIYENGYKIFDENSKIGYYDYTITPYDKSENRGDLPANVVTKVNHCYTNAYGGVMIWELSYDLADATNSNSLLNTIWATNTASPNNGYPAIAIITQPASTTSVTHGSLSGSLSVVTNKSCNYNGNTYDKAIYQWYENTVNSNVGGTPVQGATRESFSFPTSKTGTFYYYCVVKGKNSVTSNVATVKVTAGAFTIAGPTFACKNSVLTCVVSGLPIYITDNDVYWTCSSNLSPKGGNYGKTKQFDVTDAGNGWVKAKIIPLNNLILDKSVTLSRRPYYTVENLSVKSYTYYLYTPPNTPGVTNYHWVPSSPYLTLDNAYSLKLGVSTGMTGGTVVGYAISPACGESPTPDHVYILNVGKGTSSPSYIYPNPVGDILFIDVDALAQQFSSDTARQLPTFDIRLYDGQGNLLRQTTAKSGTIQFNVSKLPNGIYFLHIYDGVSETPDIQQIVVEH